MLLPPVQVAFAADAPKELPKSDGIESKSGVDDDDLLKAESQDIAEHKELFQHIHQVRHQSLSHCLLKPSEKTPLAVAQLPIRLALVTHSYEKVRYSHGCAA